MKLDNFDRNILDDGFNFPFYLFVLEMFYALHILLREKLQLQPLVLSQENTVNLLKVVIHREKLKM